MTPLRLVSKDKVKVTYNCGIPPHSRCVYRQEGTQLPCTDKCWVWCVYDLPVKKVFVCFNYYYCYFIGLLLTDLKTVLMLFTSGLILHYFKWPVTHIVHSFFRRSVDVEQQTLNMTSPKVQLLFSFYFHEFVKSTHIMTAYYWKEKRSIHLEVFSIYLTSVFPKEDTAIYCNLLLVKLCSDTVQ